MRTSSATNVGADKDSDKRQRKAIEAFAKRAGFTIAFPEDWFYDPGVSGADPIDTRPGFAALLSRLEGNGVRTVIVEDASRFARDLITQELGIAALIKRGVRVLTATGEDLTETDDPMKKAMRQIAGAFAELEKTRLVQKLRGARERKAAANAKAGRFTLDGKGKCVGRKSHAALRPEVVARAKEIAARGKRVSLRTVANELAAAGYVNANGRPYAAKSIMNMLKG